LVIPRLEVSTDTIENGEIVKFKEYLKFEPELNSPQEIKDMLHNFEFQYDSLANFESVA